MGTRCTLCRRRIRSTSHPSQCECGWVLDRGCEENHHEWCSKHGEDRWIGAVEL